MVPRIGGGLSMACWSVQRPMPARIEFNEGVRGVENAPPQPVNGPHHRNIEPSPYHVFEHRGVCGALIPAFPPGSCASQPHIWVRPCTEARGARVRCGPVTVQRMALSGPVSEKSFRKPSFLFPDTTAGHQPRIV